MLGKHSFGDSIVVVSLVFIKIFSLFVHSSCYSFTCIIKAFSYTVKPCNDDKVQVQVNMSAIRQKRITSLKKSDHLFSSSTHTMPNQESKPPTRQQRQQCWKVRDEYFACLDRLNIIDPAVVEKDPQQAKECLDCKKLYEDTCLASWVRYPPLPYSIPLTCC